MSEENISIRLTDDVDPAISKKIKAIAKDATDAHAGVTKLQNALKGISASSGLQKLQTELAKTGFAQQKLATEVNKTNAAYFASEAALNRAIAAEAKAAAATAQLAAAHNGAAISAQRLAASQAQAATAQTQGQIAAQTLTGATTRASTAQTQAMTATARLAAAQTATATATSQAAAAADRAALAALRLAQAQAKAAAGGSWYDKGISDLKSLATNAVAATAVFYGLVRGIRASVDIALKLDTVTRSLQFATGSANAGAEEFQFLREESKRLGFSLLDSAGQFAQMAAAAKGTMIQGQGVRDIFTGITQASTVLGLSADQTSGALMAIQQMISKGTISSEELRQQLGERLPGAVQIAARAMGVTTGKLGDMLKAGEVMSDDFLPKFAAELHKTFGEDAVKAADSARASITKMHNSMAENAAEVGNVFVGTYSLLAKTYLAIADNTNKAAEAQERYNATLRLNGPTADQSKSDKMNKKALEFAAKMDMFDIRRWKAEDDADSVRQKNLTEEFKEKKKLQEQAAKDALAVELDYSLAARDFKVDTFKNEMAIQYRIAQAAARERNELFDQDVNKTNQIDKSRFDLKIAKAGEDPLALIKVQHEQELIEANAHGEALRNIEDRQRLERENADKLSAKKRIEIANIERDQRLSATAGMFSGFAALAATANLKDRENRLRVKGLLIAEAVANTGLAATKALAAAPPPFNYALMAGVIAAGTAQVIGIKNAKYFNGGFTGYGNPLAEAGIVHKNEYVVPHRTLADVGGPSGMENLLRNGAATVQKGGGDWSPASDGNTHNGDVYIEMKFSERDTVADARAKGAAAADGYMEIMRNQKTVEKEAAFNGAKSR